MKKPDLWIGDSDFQSGNPLRAVITDITSGQNKWGKPEYQIFIRLENGQIKKSSLFGTNLAKLIEKLGTDSATWISKGVEIWRIEDINKKVIREFRPL
jgi:muramoyltetrapeptide carboxypeptidase LdcA involved in peptidoglycan recycling